MYILPSKYRCQKGHTFEWTPTFAWLPAPVCPECWEEWLAEHFPAELVEQGPTVSFKASYELKLPAAAPAATPEGTAAPGWVVPDTTAR